MNGKANVVVAGGCGHWSDKTHHAAVVELRKQGYNVNLAGICETVDPFSVSDRPNLASLLRLGSTSWIDAGKGQEAVEKGLDRLHSEVGIDILVIATNPIYHHSYSSWAVRNGVNFACDKPLVVNRNASFDMESAGQIWPQYNETRNAILEARERNGSYMAISPLRRRAMPLFMDIAERLEVVQQETGEGIKYINLVVNGGVHKYPLEMTNGGAHSYLDGIGSLSHSSYHYVDLLAWYLSSASGMVAKIEVELPYLFRMKDYVGMRGYRKLMDLVEGDTSLDVAVNVPEAVLNSEQDFTFHIKLKDGEDRLVGLVSYTCNHTSFTPRTHRYDSEVVEHAQLKAGGRMSHFYLDIHQGAMQNIQLVKNDIVFSGNTITSNMRVHPALGTDSVHQRLDDAYVSGTITPAEMIGNFIKYSGGMDFDQGMLDRTTRYEDQVLTNRLFSAFYELIARNASETGNTNRSASETIAIKEILRGK